MTNLVEGFCEIHYHNFNLPSVLNGSCQLLDELQQLSRMNVDGTHVGHPPMHDGGRDDPGG